MEHDNQQLTSEHAIQTLQHVRSICGVFPSVEEQIDGFGHTSLRVKDKPFIIMGEDKEGVSLSIRTSQSTQEILLSQVDSLFFKTPYIGQHGWVTQQIEPPTDWDEIEDLIREAYLRTAPKKLAALVQDPAGYR